MAGLRSLLARLDDAGIAVGELSVHTPDLDDVFLALTGHGTGDGPHGGTDAPNSPVHAQRKAA